MTNKLEAITSLCVHSVVVSRKAAVDQLACGLKPLLELSKKDPEMLKPIFVAGASSLELNSATFKSLLHFEDVELNVMNMFLKYIDTESKCSLPIQLKMIMFCTDISSSNYMRVITTKRRRS
jgi:hypothetical protein